MSIKLSAITIISILLLSTFSLLVMLVPESARATTLFVGGGAPGNFTTIQGAIDFAFPGDRIYVYNGTYQENLIVSKILSLKGEDRNTTIVDGGNSGDVIQVMAHWVNVTGFTIRNSGSFVLDAGMRISYSENCYIANNSISHNGHGIYLEETNNSVFSSNVLDNNSYVAMTLHHSEQNEISGTEFYSNLGGIELSWSDRNTLYDNRFLKSGFGIKISTSENAVLLNNSVVEGGISINAYNLKHWNTHAIDTSNQVNGKPVYYWKNKTGGAIPQDAGEAILANSSNVIVQNIDVGIGSLGVILGYSHNCTVVNNKASVYLTESDNNIIANNTPYSPLGIQTTSSDNNIIANNSISACSGCIWIDSAINTTLINNTVTSGSLYGIHTHSSEKLAITGNQVSGGGTGLLMYSTFRSDVTNNTLTGNFEQGILLDLVCSYNNIKWNNISNNDDGIKIDYYSQFNNITNNNIFSNSNRAVYLVESENNTIRDNNITRNLDGIQFFEAEYNIIEENDITANDRDGMSFLYSDVNIIRNNTIELSQRFGLHLNWSFGNQIYHNNITGNSQQAFDDTYANQWDNGYPSGGNNWSDYLGTDQFSGPDQDIPGSDGIGDTPYDIDGDSRDRYPFYNQPPFTPPSEPRFLWADPSDRQVHLTWTAPGDDGGIPLTNYRIYRGPTSGGEVFLVEIGNVTTYTDVGLLNGVEYFYQVSAVNAVGEGPLSNEANATPKVPPGSPGSIGADLTGLWYEDVTLTWGLSSDDGAGQNSVVSYEIYRNMTFDPDGLGYGLLASVANGTTSYTDMWAGEPDMDSYFYRICALDKFGIESCSGTQASKFTRYIMRGMNLVSFPVIPANDDSATILQTVYHDESWIYDSLSKTWRSSVAMKPYSQVPGLVNNTMGMWIDVTFGSNFTVAGVVPDQTTIQLRAGWNLVGFPSFSATYTVADLKAETGATRVEGYDPSSPPYFLKPLQDFDPLKAGEGYWLLVPADIIWTVQN